MADLACRPQPAIVSQRYSQFGRERRIAGSARLIAVLAGQVAT